MSPSRHGGGGRSIPSAPSTPRWAERLDDPDEPLFTLAVTADLLEIDTQALRRLEAAAGLTSDRPSGNQRRFSRRDIERLARATDLNRQGNDQFFNGGNRWGSNHMYEPARNWPVGNHLGHTDGAVQWVSGAEVRLRILYPIPGQSDMFW